MKEAVDKDISETIATLGAMPMSREARARCMVLLHEVLNSPTSAGMDAPLSELFTTLQRGLETEAAASQGSLFNADETSSLVVRRLYALLESLIRHFDVLAGEARDTQWFRQRLVESKTDQQIETIFDELEERLLDSDSRLSLDREREEKALGYLQRQCEDLHATVQQVHSALDDPATESQRAELGRVADRIMVVERKIHELRSGLRNRSDLSLKDDWTGLYRDEGFTARATELFSRWARAGSPLSAVVVTINVGGDRVLTPLARHELMRQTASEIQGRVRLSDLVGLTGDDQFTLVLPDTALEGCHAFASRLVLALETAGFNQLGKQLRVAVAAGITAAVEGDSLESLLGRAAKARDEAESKGVCCEALA